MLFFFISIVVRFDTGELLFVYRYQRDALSFHSATLTMT
jgi:hypothetical protein